MFQAKLSQGTCALVSRSFASLLSAAACVASLSLFVASTASASLWESDDWALIGDLAGSVTYDSNVFGFRDGEGDTIFGVTPALTLQRKASASDIKIIAQATRRSFADLSDQNSTDPSILVNFQYPNTGEALVQHRARLGWSRQKDRDYSIGNRLERTELEGSWQGVLRDNGKTRIIANLGGRDTSYGDFRSDVASYDAGVGLAWARHELFEYTATLNYLRSEYSDFRGQAGDTTLNGYSLNIGARGEFTPKITGEASIGFGENKYSGGIGGSDMNWFTSANVAWQATERRQLSLDARRATYFDALDTAYNRLQAGLSFRQAMAGGFASVLRAGIGEYDYSDSGSNRKDTFVRLGAGLEYSLTGRLAAGLDFNWTDKDSDREDFTFSQYEIIGRASWRF